MKASFYRNLASFLGLAVTTAGITAAVVLVTDSVSPQPKLKSEQVSQLALAALILPNAAIVPLALDRS